MHAGTIVTYFKCQRIDVTEPNGLQQEMSQQTL